NLITVYTPSVSSLMGYARRFLPQSSTESIVPFASIRFLNLFTRAAEASSSRVAVVTIMVSYLAIFCAPPFGRMALCPRKGQGFCVLFGTATNYSKPEGLCQGLPRRFSGDV